LGVPAFPPVDTTQSLLYLAVATAGLALLDASATAGRGGRRASKLGRWLAIGLTLGLSLHPMVRHQWSAGTASLTLAALAIAAALLWRGYQAVDAGLPAAASRASWIAVCAGAGVLLALARSALLGQLAAGIAVALAALQVAPRRSGPSPPPATAISFLAPMLLALVTNGAFYAELGVAPALALAVSPLAAAAALAASGRSVAARATLAVAGVAIVLAPFVAGAALDYAADNHGYDY
jgi:hypothetical protein